ncbi:formate C-acetyltransferase [Actinoplanes sp. NPDC051851]|uniref:formate C-acetyltransferase n=1 Tax=Actinoplanes sp. NPDC051851 TaxID=3154753 RepID=UPI0034178F78
MTTAWRGFRGSDWRDGIDVGAFIHDNVVPYTGGPEFLSGPTARTERIWGKLQAMFPEERERGIYDVDTHTPSSLTSHAPGYIDEGDELIVGLQTSAPLRRAIMPAGGLRMVQQGLAAYGYCLDSTVRTIYSQYRKTHNDGVFDAYPADVKAARRSHIITGLPDAYGRGRIIGDYRRVALYGVDRLLSERKERKASLDASLSSEDVIRDREELAEQIRALEDLRYMASRYGYDISGPATTGREAIQWLYFAYLGATKEQNGAAMSLGRTSSFVDVYLQRDIDEGTLTEEQAQELIDDFVIKLRIIRFLRTPEYDQLFSGDPTWVTESLGGIGCDGRPLVTRSSFRYLQTLYNLGPAPEPNLTVLWSPALPDGFKRFCAQVSIDTSAIQYENDDLIRPAYSDDTAIACCVSAMRVGKDMQFFGARANLAKALLYAINGGRDEMSGEQIFDAPPITDDVLSFPDVMEKYDKTLDWLASTYVSALNVIHYMHDKYAYERLEMALHDHPVHRFLATGIAGLSVAADSLAAIKYAQVKALRDENGLVVDYAIDGEFPAFGNNDDRADAIAVDLVERFMEKIRRQPTYRNAEPSLSVLTITSNVVYGKHTGNTPDGRRAGEPFAPGANPMNGRDKHGLVAAALSVAKLPYRSARDGISLTTTVTPDGLGHNRPDRITNLVGVLDGYTDGGGFHLNVNVLNRATLEDAMANPSEYPQLTIRVSGYAVNFVKLTVEQQKDVISRTFHGSL